MNVKEWEICWGNANKKKAMLMLECQLNWKFKINSGKHIKRKLLEIQEGQKDVIFFSDSSRGHKKGGT